MNSMQSTIRQYAAGLTLAALGLFHHLQTFLLFTSSDGSSVQLILIMYKILKELGSNILFLVSNFGDSFSHVQNLTKGRIYSTIVRYQHHWSGV